MKRYAMIPLLFGLIPACAGPAPVGEVSSPIIGGTKDVNDPAVVLLISYPPDKSTFYTCTAVAVAPTVLITAAHCVDGPGHPSFLFGAFTGPDASAYPDADAFSKVLVPATMVAAHPAYDPNPPFTADIGVVVLAQPLGMAPLPFNHDPVDPALVGGPARLVGYGQTVYQQFNVTKYEATTILQAIDPMADTVTVGDAMHRSCIGDSGGPALVKIKGVETIVGVDSYTDNIGCMDPAHYRRTDMYWSFIDKYIAAEQMDGGTDGGGGTGGGGAGGGASSASSSAAEGSSSSSASGASSSSGAGGAGGGASGGGSSGGCSCEVPGGREDSAPAMAGILVPLALALGRRAASRRRASRR